MNKSSTPFHYIAYINRNLKSNHIKLDKKHQCVLSKFRLYSKCFVWFYLAINIDILVNTGNVVLC